MGLLPADVTVSLRELFTAPGRGADSVLIVSGSQALPLARSPRSPVLGPVSPSHAGLGRSVNGTR